MRATPASLRGVEAGEEVIRAALRMRSNENLRLRLVHRAGGADAAGGAAHSVVVEVDGALVPLAKELVSRNTIVRQFTELGLIAAGDAIGVRPFKSGSLSASSVSDYTKL